MTTTTLPTILANYFANLPYNRAQARKERRRREAERVCRETQAAGETATREVAVAAAAAAAESEARTP